MESNRLFLNLFFKSQIANPLKSSNSSNASCKHKIIHFHRQRRTLHLAKLALPPLQISSYSMEIESLFPKPTYGGIKRSWRRRRYHRLDGNDAVPNGKKMKVVRLKGNPRKNWRIRAVPKLRWVVMSPLKMLSKLKNVYMNFMLKSMNPDNVFGQKRIPKAREVSKGLSNEEFEARLIFEISKALVASHELYPM